MDTNKQALWAVIREKDEKIARLTAALEEIDRIIDDPSQFSRDIQNAVNSGIRPHVKRTEGVT